MKIATMISRLIFDNYTYFEIKMETRLEMDGHAEYLGKAGEIVRNDH
jgi:hypothetical protein